MSDLRPAESRTRVYKCNKCGYVSRAFGNISKIDHPLGSLADFEMERHFAEKHPEIVAKHFLEYCSIAFLELSGMSELAERAMEKIRTALTLAGIKHRVEEGWAACEIKVYIFNGNEGDSGE